ncbi:DUF6221 family protein [Streptomyces sp. NPDC091292]|uniref:DUF6221 family protein n=1 Tax=Streptomyces sp. NPDC091292 TaxID=3365991 RepID=UPI00381E9617
MDDLVDWLRAQLDEDKRIAQAATWCDDAATWRAAVSEYGTPARPGGPRWYVEDSMEDGVVTTVDPQASADEGVALHIAEHDPARVLREIDAKRRVLNTLHEEGGDRMFADIFHLLALPYADRPGYRQEWAPTP